MKQKTAGVKRLKKNTLTADVVQKTTGENARFSGLTVFIALIISMLLVFFICSELFTETSGTANPGMNSKLLVLPSIGKKAKLPVCVSGWSDFKHSGVTAIRYFNGNLYVLDGTRSQIFQYNNDGGIFLNKWDGCCSVVEDSKRNALILFNDGNVGRFINGKKSNGERFFKGVPRPAWFEIDADDNFYLASPQDKKIYKFSSDFVKIAEFGGNGEGDDKFNNLGRIFLSGDEIFCINILPNQSGCEIKVFSTTGKFLRRWNIKGIKTFSNLNNLAIVNDRVYMNSFEESKLVEMDRNGGFIRSITYDANNKYFNYPVSMCDGRGNGYFYVAMSKIATYRPGN